MVDTVVRRKGAWWALCKAHQPFGLTAFPSLARPRLGGRCARLYTARRRYSTCILCCSPKPSLYVLACCTVHVQRVLRSRTTPGRGHVLHPALGCGHVFELVSRFPPVSSTSGRATWTLVSYNLCINSLTCVLTCASTSSSYPRHHRTRTRATSTSGRSTRSSTCCAATSRTPTARPSRSGCRLSRVQEVTLSTP